MRSFRIFRSSILERYKNLHKRSREKTHRRSMRQGTDLNFVEIIGIIFFTLGLIIGLTGHIVDNYISHNPGGFSPLSVNIEGSRPYGNNQKQSSTLENIIEFVRNYVSPIKLFLDFYSNISTDLVFTALTILIVDKAYEFRSEQQILRHLKRQMASKYNQVVLEAVKELTELNALYDERLNGIDLRDADLTSAPLEGAIIKGAILENAILINAKMSGINLDGSNLNNVKLLRGILVGASLRECKFYQTDLTNADLSWVDLSGSTFITEEQLISCNSLWGATLPDGEKYDGKYDLQGDIDEARKFGVNYDDPEDRVQFYSQDR